MGSFPLLDTFLGLAFVYLLLALVCTTLMEWIAQLLNLRGKMLVHGTRDVLGEAEEQNPAFTNHFFQHPLIRSLGAEGRTPSYIPSEIFAKVLRDIVRQRAPRAEAVVPAVPTNLRESLRTLQAEVRREPAPAEVAAYPNEQAFDEEESPTEQSLAKWYDRAMERVSGSYKRQTRVIVFVLSVVVTVVLNASTLTLSSNLWQSPTLRALLIERAKTRLDEGPPLQTVEYTDPTNPQPTAPIAQDSTKSPNVITDDEEALLGQLFGWRSAIDGYQRAQGVWGVTLLILATLTGWAITALAVSLGAPFWFDTLNRFMNLRSTGDIPPKTT